MQRLWWNLIYLLGKTPWDTGVTPPELRAAVEGHGFPSGGGPAQPGRALDLGCGTGTNTIYLAQNDFDVTGVDISSRAVAAARRKIERAGLAARARVYAGDVTRLETLPVTGLFDLALDIGCFHNLDGPSRLRYVAGLAPYMQPGGLYLLYAFGPRVQLGRHAGISPQDAERLFAPAFALLQVNHGQDRGSIESAWYTLKRHIDGGTP